MITGECIPPRTISVAASAFNLILTIANLDLNAFQVNIFLAFKIESIWQKLMAIPVHIAKFLGNRIYLIYISVA